MSQKFKLTDSFIDKYKNIPPSFGFNGLGELTYMRTYSRIKDDGKNEVWWETIRRVVEGVYNMQKNHILKYNLGWSEVKAQYSAQEMYDRMFNMKFLPPGRGLWAMGTSITDEKQLFAALNNCSFVSTNNLKQDLSKPFCFLMDMSMLGVGVGFDTKGKEQIVIHQPKQESELYVIPDTREGWVDSLKLLLESYFVKNKKSVQFDYSQIRKYGELIKTFGGKASGPDPLIKMHTSIRQLFDNREGDLITDVDIVDVMNFIGVCVVAGNVRRTAEISFGDYNSDAYLKLKDYKWDGEKYVGSNAKRASHGWASNNSIFADIGMNYEKVGNQTANNGEPGYAWLENMQGYSRMNSGKDYKDNRVMGGNPCLEQSLESYELCCLVENFPSRHDSIDDFKKTLKYAYLYAKTVTLGQTHWPETNKVMLRNRRIGTSQSGIVMAIEKLGIEQYRQWCEQGYEAIERYDEIYSEWLCVPLSKKKTSVKPSGSVSLLPGVTPGMHFPESNYYIRRINISKSSDLVQKCIDAGYKIKQSVYDTTSMIVEIPVAVEGIRTVNEVSMWEQLALAAFLQKYWADNQVSCTVTFKPHEGSDIKYALNYYQYQLKGISFLPKLEKGTTYAQMPYEEIDKQTYHSLMSNIKQLDFKDISEESTPEKFCDSSKCEI